jgi:redox-sensitive bicupin YhaK (pirin superfamily)
MEIISYVLEGALEHKDSLGTGSVIRPGDVQRMSAGTGVAHSEFNASRTEPVHFLQIWLLPSQRGLQPSYEQKSFERADLMGNLRCVAADDARFGSLKVHADARLYAGRLGDGHSSELELAPGRHAWIQVAAGSVSVNGERVQAGDGVALSEEPRVHLDGHGDPNTDGGHVLVFDLG